MIETNELIDKYLQPELHRAAQRYTFTNTHFDVAKNSSVENCMMETKTTVS